MRKNLVHILFVSFGAMASHYVTANAGEQKTAHRISVAKIPLAIAPQDDISVLATDVTDLKFGEFFKMPIGPRGLDPSEKLLSLAGKRVRIVGYMVRQETPAAGVFMLVPLPVALGDEDEALSDDLPASTVFVHVGQAAQSESSKPVPHYAGLLRLTGTLSLGSFDEPDGHVSTVRLQLDSELVQAL